MTISRWVEANLYGNFPSRDHRGPVFSNGCESFFSESRDWLLLRLILI